MGKDQVGINNKDLADKLDLTLDVAYYIFKVVLDKDVSHFI